jgi:hypothetical protein
MFGQKDDDKDENNGATDPMQAVSDGAEQLLATEPQTTDTSAAPVGDDGSLAPPPAATDGWSQPAASDSGTTEGNKDVISPAGGYPSSPNDRIQPGGESEPEVTLPEPAITYTPDSATSTDDSGMVSDSDVSDAELIDIKKKALSELIPLIDKLDQPPLEKFRTIMMMIQASDDQRLVEKAYESAHSIEDEEARAQALLDIVNEVNYFTQPHNEETSQAV